MHTNKTGTRRALARIREIVSDMNYAQRRVVESRYGIPPQESRYSRTAREQTEELEALFEREPVTAGARDRA